MPDQRNRQAVMAAQEKLTASARKFIRNIEDAVSSKEGLKDTAHSLETAFKTVFAACTSGTPATSATMESADLGLVATSGSKSTTRKDDGQEEYGEHIYAQLFFDDQVKAAKAVNALRSQEQKSPTRSTPQSPHKPFPVSTPPPRTSRNPLVSDELNIPQNNTFDDAISAISAHTLEAMEKKALSKQATRSNDSSLFSESPLAHSRSNKSWRSKNSQSTRTTETSNSFEHMWHQQEAKFWQAEVRADERRRPRLPPSSHPHETMPRDLLRDPDRIALCLDVGADAELAEI